MTTKCTKKVHLIYMCRNLYLVASLIMIWGITWLMYLLHFCTSIVFQKRLIPQISSDFGFGLASRLMNPLVRGKGRISVWRFWGCFSPINSFFKNCCAVLDVYYSAYISVNLHLRYVYIIAWEERIWGQSHMLTMTVLAISWIVYLLSLFEFANLTNCNTHNC